MGISSIFRRYPSTDKSTAAQSFPDYLYFTAVGTDAVLSVDLDEDGTNYQAVDVVTLKNVDLTNRVFHNITLGLTLLAHPSTVS